jgi:hypothetical protein
MQKAKEPSFPQSQTQSSLLTWKKQPTRKQIISLAHACNPSYLGGRDQEDLFKASPRQIVLNNLARRKPITKRGLEVWLKR